MPSGTDAGMVKLKLPLFVAVTVVPAIGLPEMRSEIVIVVEAGMFEVQLIVRAEPVIHVASPVSTAVIEYLVGGLDGSPPLPLPGFVQTFPDKLHVLEQLGLVANTFSPEFFTM